MTPERCRDAARVLQKADEAGRWNAEHDRRAVAALASEFLGPDYAEVGIYACPYFSDVARRLGRKWAFMVDGSWDDALCPYESDFELRKG